MNLAFSFLEIASGRGYLTLAQRRTLLHHRHLILLMVHNPMV
jgi:hypothetical protein